MLRAAASVIGLSAAFVLVLYLAYSGDTVPGPSPTPTTPVAVTTTPFTADFAPSVTPTPPYSMPASLNGVDIGNLELGTEIEFPEGVALIVETGCWGCEGGPSGLVRVYVRSDGSIAYEPLIDREGLGVPPQLNTAPDGTVYEFRSPLTGYAIRPDGSRIVASLCAREHCGRGGEGYAWSANSQTAIFSSSDGGVIWTEIGRLEIGAEVLAILPDDRILLATFPAELETTLQTFPDASVIKRPEWASPWNVDVLPSGAIVWRDDSGVPRLSDGQPLLSLVQDVEAAQLVDFLVNARQMDGLALLSGNATHAPYANYLMPFDNAGTIGRGSFAWAGDPVIWSGPLLRLGVELPNDGVILGNASVPTSELAPGGYPIVTDYDPVVVDLKQGTIRVLSPFTGSDFPRGRNHIVAVQRGPFARVVGTDSCLNVRQAPDTGAQILDCLADGVLVQVTGGFYGSGPEWLEIATPAGIQGWASTQYLEH